MIEFELTKQVNKVGFYCGGVFGLVKSARNHLKSFINIFSNPEPFYRWGAKIFVKILYRVDFQGFDKIPDEGPAIIIANHVSYVDGLILHTACRRPVVYMIDEHIYNVPAVKYFMDMNGAIPILPNRESVTQALEEVSEFLRKGALVCIFPEGSLTYTGNMTRFKFGIEWIIERDPVPIYPVAIKGLWGSILSRKYRKSKFQFIPRSFRRKVNIVCGEVISPDDVKISHLQRIVMDLKNSI